MALGTKSRAFLEFLLLCGMDTLEGLTHPRAAIMGCSGFDSERNFDRVLEKLRQSGHISTKSGDGIWALELTREGKAELLDDLDPPGEWRSPWDGKWRTLFFDLPERAKGERARLERWLRKRRFGPLQGSVWITHRPYDDWTRKIAGQRIDPQAVMFQECTPLVEADPGNYVSKAWDFDAINRHYSAYLSNLSRSSPDERLDQVWIARDATLWKRAFEADPFLPDSLLPKGYSGKEAWSLRAQTFRERARNLDRISHPGNDA